RSRAAAPHRRLARRAGPPRRRRLAPDICRRKNQEPGRRQRRRPPMTELPEPADYVERKVRAMSQSILDACVQHFETDRRDDDLCAAFHALRDVMIVLISRLSPADQRGVVRILQKDSNGWPAYAEEINARDRERFGRH